MHDHNSKLIRVRQATTFITTKFVIIHHMTHVSMQKKKKYNYTKLAIQYMKDKHGKSAIVSKREFSPDHNEFSLSWSCSPVGECSDSFSGWPSVSGSDGLTEQLLCNAASLSELANSAVLADDVTSLWSVNKTASLSVLAGSGELALCLRFGDTVGVATNADELLESAWYPSDRPASSQIKSFNTFHLRREGFFGRMLSGFSHQFKASRIHRAKSNWTR